MSLTRDQFQAYLEYGFNNILFYAPSVIKTILLNDKSGMNFYITRVLRADVQIQDYLDEWDAAPNQAAKDAVVASVVYEIDESIPVDPDAAVLWPGTGGRFGDATGPMDFSQNSVVRPLNSAFLINMTEACLVHYSVDISCTIASGSGQTGTVFLEIAQNAGFTLGVQELARFVNGGTKTLPVGINTSVVTGELSGYVPQGFYVRIRTQNTVGLPAFSYKSGQEVTL